MGIMDRSARLLVKEMSWAADKETLDMQQPIQDMTLNVVGQSAFGCAFPFPSPTAAQISCFTKE